MIWERIKRENRMAIRYIGYMSIVLLLIFDLNYLLISCTEKGVIEPDIPSTDILIIEYKTDPSDLNDELC